MEHFIKEALPDSNRDGFYSVGDPLPTPLNRIFDFFFSHTEWHYERRNNPPTLRILLRTRFHIRVSMFCPLDSLFLPMPLPLSLFSCPRTSGDRTRFLLVFLITRVSHKLDQNTNGDFVSTAIMDSPKNGNAVSYRWAFSVSPLSPLCKRFHLPSYERFHSTDLRKDYVLMIRYTHD